MVRKITKFINEEIWKENIHEKSPWYSFFIQQLRTIILAFRGFMEDRVSLRASALTFYTLLSLVPIVAMGFGVAKGFGFDARLEEFIMENFKGQEEVMNWVIDLSDQVLEGVQGGVLAGIGLLILIWSIMRVLTNIEGSFNAIWQIRKPRTFFRKLADYLSIMLIGPFLIIISSSVMIYLTSRVESAQEGVIFFQVITPAIKTLLGFIPYTLIWLAFTLLYIIMPNTRVNFKYALLAGIIAGTLFQIVQWAYVHFQIGVTKYSAIYGTFAALPLFLVWLQISWLIVLLGAEISFAYQNVTKYAMEAESLSISNHNKRILSILIVHYIIKNFEKGEEPPTSEEIGEKLGIPLRLVRDVLFDLTTAKILVETLKDNPKEKGFQPATDINKINLKFVIERLDDIGSDKIVVDESELYKKIEKMYDEIFNRLRDSSVNVTIKDL
ncbi:MAG: YhjD/YihY/BrkB family envelope integrity protein [Bacteroidota bacterium]